MRFYFTIVSLLVVLVVGLGSVAHVLFAAQGPRPEPTNRAYGGKEFPTEKPAAKGAPPRVNAPSVSVLWTAQLSEHQTVALVKVDASCYHVFTLSTEHGGAITPVPVKCP